jgi:hypothetical protein
MRAAAVAWLLFLVPAHAGWCDVQIPPPSLQQAPTIEYWVESLPIVDLERVCGVPGGPIGMAGGCAPYVSEGEVRVVYIRDDLDEREFECVERHELAHLPPNNWDHGPTWRSLMIGGEWAPTPLPRWRRPEHVDPFYFVRGRKGTKWREGMEVMPAMKEFYSRL